MTTDVMEEKNVHLSNFDEFEKTVRATSPVHAIRRAAIERFETLGFPDTENEEWRFTDTKQIARIPFTLASPDSGFLSEDRVKQFLQGIGVGQVLVFVNGRYDPKHSRIGALTTRVFSYFLENHPDWVIDHLARYAKFQNDAFTALNTAFICDGALICIPENSVQGPIYFVYISATDGEPTVSHPRALVLASPNSKATIVEVFLGSDRDVYLTNAVTEIALDEGAVIDHYKVQQESTEAFHVATTQVQMSRGSNFSSHFVSLGGSLVRNNINAVLVGERCECTLNGLYMASGTQHVDCHTVIDHAMPHCASHELYKAILDDKGQGVFNGKIFVRQDAQKTDAKQTNQTLLLSNDATINTKPQLEIFADDVKCTHGATVGQLSEDQVFYLRSRGIGEAEARKLLTFAFANDIVNRIKVEPIREQLEQMLLRGQA